MKRMLLVAALAAAALGATACSGCSEITKVAGAVAGNQPIAGSTTLDEKAVLAAQAGQYAVEVATKAALDQGLIVPGSARAKQIAAAETAIDNAMAVVGRAYAVGAATSPGERLKAVRDAAAALPAASSAIADAWKLIPTEAKG